ncbi:MAG: hypothetical protein Ct9H300mP4_13290 [Gammaproteobacteria bacterium]|nr:MAG: hypothetical protein Ct9H300mP4_13290 [Gammaproteobacteria bacterium]
MQALSPKWRGPSDTEILLAGFLAWGVVGTLQRAIGCFHLLCGIRRALFDPWAGQIWRETTLLWLVGEQWPNPFFLVRSLSLYVHPHFDNPINREHSDYTASFVVPRLIQSFKTFSN